MIGLVPLLALVGCWGLSVLLTIFTVQSVMRIML